MAKAIGRASAPSRKKKPRHTAAQKKAARQARELSARSSRREDRKSYADRKDRTDRPRRQWDRDERAGERQQRGPRREFDTTRLRRDDDHRGPRKQWDREDRGPRKQWDREDRGPRKQWDREDRGPRKQWDREDRGPRKQWDREDRGPRKQWDREGRPARRDDAQQARRNHDWERRERRDNRAFSEDRERPSYTRQEQRPPATPKAAPEGPNGFAELGLNDELIARLTELGLVTPFPIQAATIPDALAGRDLLGRGQTGSGKTLAFGLPTIQRLAEGKRAVPHRPRALILTPTRELAMQIVDSLRPLLSALRLRHQLVAGGMSYTPQLRSLEQGVDLLVATPGRLSDLLERRAADLRDVAITVLDEADHMAEMGFVEAISEILDQTPEGGQRLLFSATLDHGVDQVAAKYLTDPVTHETDSATASVSTMEHHVFLIDPQHKKPVTATIANRPGRTIVFVRTKLGADRIALQLRESGVFAAALHGGLNQAQRTRVLAAFKSGELPVLVATDVAARGIHVDDVSLVLQADPPADHKDYLHRSGRTARAGEAGRVVTLALPHQKRQVQRMLDAAGVDAAPVRVKPQDAQVLETAGGREPSYEAIPQSQLDNLLRPRRPQGRGNYRGKPRRDFDRRGPRGGGHRSGGHRGGGQRGGGQRGGGYRGQGGQDSRRSS